MQTKQVETPKKTRFDEASLIGEIKTRLKQAIKSHSDMNKPTRARRMTFSKFTLAADNLKASIINSTTATLEDIITELTKNILIASQDRAKYHLVSQGILSGKTIKETKPRYPFHEILTDIFRFASLKALGMKTLNANLIDLYKTVVATHETTMEKLDTVQKENETLKKQIADLQEKSRKQDTALQLSKANFALEKQVLESNYKEQLSKQRQELTEARHKVEKKETKSTALADERMERLKKADKRLEKADTQNQKLQDQVSEDGQWKKEQYEDLADKNNKQLLLLGGMVQKTAQLLERNETALNRTNTLMLTSTSNQRNVVESPTNKLETTTPISIKKNNTYRILVTNWYSLPRATLFTHLSNYIQKHNLARKSMTHSHFYKSNAWLKDTFIVACKLLTAVIESYNQTDKELATVLGNILIDNSDKLTTIDKEFETIIKNVATLKEEKTENRKASDSETQVPSDIAKRTPLQMANTYAEGDTQAKKIGLQGSNLSFSAVFISMLKTGPTEMRRLLPQALFVKLASEFEPAKLEKSLNEQTTSTDSTSPSFTVSETVD